MNSILWLCLLLLYVAKHVKSEYKYDNYPLEVLEEAKLQFEDLLKKYNYPCEVHYVVTADQYILRMHRIPRVGAKPVFLMHGILDSSMGWIIMGPWSSLGYYLYDNGYDVWMGNARGNRYSRNHSIHDPDKDDYFWKFSFHEIGYYDLPAMIDYILKNTNRTKLTYFGHSQGTTVFFIMASLRPEYNDKINSMHALAPVAFMRHMKVLHAPLLRDFTKPIKEAFNLEFLPISMSKSLTKFCLMSKRAEDSCLDTLYLVMGKETKEFNKTMLPVLVGQYPNGCSINQLLHYMQLWLSDRFRRYDYGVRTNLETYDKPEPPDYPLKNIRAPVALYYTSNDYLSNDIDVRRLRKQLPNVIKDCLYPYKDWNHITVMWGINARKLAHRDMLKLMRKYERN